MAAHAYLKNECTEDKKYQKSHELAQMSIFIVFQHRVDIMVVILLPAMSPTPGTVRAILYVNGPLSERMLRQE